MEIKLDSQEDSEWNTDLYRTIHFHVQRERDVSVANLEGSVRNRKKLETDRGNK